MADAPQTTLLDEELVLLARPWLIRRGGTPAAAKLVQRGLLTRCLGDFFRTPAGAAALTEACDDGR